MAWGPAHSASFQHGLIISGDHKGGTRRRQQLLLPAGECLPLSHTVLGVCRSEQLPAAGLQGERAPAQDTDKLQSKAPKGSGSSNEEAPPAVKA